MLEEVFDGSGVLITRMRRETFKSTDLSVRTNKLITRIAERKQYQNIPGTNNCFIASMIGQAATFFRS